MGVKIPLHCSGENVLDQGTDLCICSCKATQLVTEETVQVSSHSSGSSWFGTVPYPLQGLGKMSVEISTLIGYMCLTVEEKEEEK